MVKNNKNLVYQVQTIINCVCSPKISILPSKFDAFNQNNFKILLKKLKQFIKIRNINILMKILEMDNSIQGILHFIFTSWKYKQ